MNPPPDSLDDRIRAYYESQHLDDATLEQLKRTAGASPYRPRPPAAPSHARRWAAVVVAACLIGVLGVLLVERHAPIAWEERVAREIAENHRHRLDPEFQASDFPALAASMARLGFTPVRPARLDEAGLDLVGGNYCSIEKVVAAQVCLEDTSGRPATLYQFRAAEAPLQGEYTRAFGGVRVTLWHEAGLLMGLAQSVPQ